MLCIRCGAKHESLTSHLCPECRFEIEPTPEPSHLPAYIWASMAAIALIGFTGVILSIYGLFRVIHWDKFQ